MTDTIKGALVLAPLFVLFALFFGVLYFRSKYNKAHPQLPIGPEQIERRSLVVSIALALIFVGMGLIGWLTGYVVPSWSVVLYGAWGAYMSGYYYGRWDANRRAKNPSRSEPDFKIP